VKHLSGAPIEGRLLSFNYDRKISFENTALNERVFEEKLLF